MVRSIYLFAGIVLVAVCLMMTSCARKVNEGREKRSAYTSDRELNDVVNQWTKEGWKIHGSSHTLEGALRRHYERLAANSNLTERIGTATNCKSAAVCRLTALNNASMDYAMAVAHEVEGRFKQELSVDESNEKEYNKLEATFAGKLEGDIRSRLEESFALIRTEKGKSEYMIFFLLDREAARKMKSKAIEEIMDEADMQPETKAKLREYMDRNDER